MIAVVLTNLLTASLIGGMAISSAHEEKKAMPKMMDGMQKCHQMMIGKLGKADKNYDLRFINQMIMHHQGAIEMAKDAQKKAQHQEIKNMSQDIISAQSQEIDQLKAWRKAWYNQ